MFTHIFAIAVDIYAISELYDSTPDTTVAATMTAFDAFCVAAWCICSIFDYRHAELYAAHFVVNGVPFISGWAGEPILCFLAHVLVALPVNIFYFTRLVRIRHYEDDPLS